MPKSRPLGRKTVLLSTPASIANLGPGLDTLGLAVNLYLRLRVRSSESAGTNELRFQFHNVELNGENLIERAFRYLMENREFPSLDIDIETDIPLRSGLGSSAAAVAAGFRLYEAVAGSLPLERLLAAGCALEGHPENVAAALMGGLVVCCQSAGGQVIALPAPWPRTLRIVVATPEIELETRRSRAVLPDMVPLRAAIANVQRVSLLLESLRKRRYDLLAESLRDCLHQPNRCALVPGLSEMLALRHPDLLGLCLSGSGPSVAAIAQRNLDEIASLLSATYLDAGVRSTTRILRVHPGVA